jgi:O-antigen biosynthesis protein
VAVVVQDGRKSGRCNAARPQAKDLPAQPRPSLPRLSTQAATSLLQRIASQRLAPLTRRAIGKLRTAAHRCSPRLYQWCIARLRELHYSRLYAKEYEQREFAYQPLISIVVPVYNPPIEFLLKAVESIKRQKYANWELCIADDASTDARIKPVLERLQSDEPRAKIVFLPNNQHIAGATNAAMRQASGEYLLFMDNDDVLFTPWALTAFIDALQDNRADMLYADNVMIDRRGAVQSLAQKPDWEIDFLFSTCYITHPLMIRKQFMKRLGEFRSECSGAQDIDVINRAAALSPNVKHVSKYLYGWRILPGSVTTSTDAKPTIIPRSIQSHNDSLGKRQAFAASTWPAFFEKRRIGAFKLQFSGLRSLVDSLALVVVNRGQDVKSDQFENLLRSVPYPLSDVFVLTDEHPSQQSHPLPENICHTIRPRQLLESLSRIHSDYVLFLDSSIDVTYPTAVDELLGYLLLDPKVGVVAGKVLEHEHRICCSSYVFLDHLRMFGQGRCDGEYDGYWYKNRLAHNVLAVPDRFFLTRTSLLAKYGLQYDKYGDYAVADFCLRLRDDAIRVVYNPWAVCLSPQLCLQPTGGRGYQAFRRQYSDLFGNDPYYLRNA